MHLSDVLQVLIQSDSLFLIFTPFEVRVLAETNKTIYSTLAPSISKVLCFTLLILHCLL